MRSRSPLWLFRAVPIVAVAIPFLAVPVQSKPESAGEIRDEQAVAIVKKMIDAHGGYERWSSSPTVRFQDKWSVPGTPEGPPSRVTVEQGPRRVYIDFPGTGMRMAWNGDKAWSENWQAPYPPRFYAQLNYYFLNLPWMTMDPGVNLGKPGTDRISGEGIDYITIRMTFEDGVGDTPDDYYLLYIDPETYRLKANRYIVTYKSLLPEGVTATPEHLLVYDEFETVDGLLVPTKFTVYEEGRVYATCNIGEWSFTDRFDEARMTMQDGAVVDDSDPGV